MNLYKIEDAIAEYRNISRSDILKMPFYEFMLKLEIMKERSDEQRKQQDQEYGKQKSLSNAQKYAQPKLPKMPKLPSGYK